MGTSWSEKIEVPSSLDGIFKPTSIAVIGSSGKKGSIGQSILHNLIDYDFNGKMFPVNPRAKVIHFIKCCSTILEVPDAVDLATIIVPRDRVAPVLEQCGDKGVRGVVIILSGFKEIGEQGAAKEPELMGIIGKYNMWMIVPNCFGVLNASPDMSTNATFSKAQPLRGRLGFMSRSGALGEVTFDHANQLHLGFSVFASVGNQADVSGNDFLEYWWSYPQTEIILLYLESFDNPREFAPIAREMTRKKPIVAVKAGPTDVGAQAVSSRAGVPAGLDVATDVLLEQCGVLRVTSIDELFDVAVALSHKPLPRGDRIAVIANAGRPGILATDANVGLGMRIAAFGDRTLRLLRENLPAVASVNNPVDAIAAGGPDLYRIAMDTVLSDDHADAVIVIFVPPVVVDHRAVVNAILEMIDKHENDKTVSGCFMAVPSGVTGSKEMVKHMIPIYIFPESAAKAVAAMVRRRKLIDRSESETVDFEVDCVRTQGVIDAAASLNPSTIVGRKPHELLEGYGIGAARSIRVGTEQEAERATSKLGFPVVLKIENPEVSRKTDVGGVSAGPRTTREVLTAFRTMEQEFGKSEDGFTGIIVQEMVQNGVETIAGMHQDPSLEPLIAFRP